MSTDKELLELAAKAATVKIWWDDETESFLHQYASGLTDEWNPLTDDGDALRLAVKLKMDVFGGHENRYTETGSTVFQEEVINNDPYAATRRVIVLAAAAIGKEMP